MDIHLSSRLQEVLRLSRKQALELGYDYIGMEHLLLGILAEGNGVSSPGPYLRDWVLPNGSNVFF